VFEADLVIVGGGPVGLTIAREFFNSRTRVLVLESGLLDETSDHAVLAERESVGEPHTEAQTHKRMAFHGPSASTWSHEQQPYGVRCRALGGSSNAWAGKSAAFDPIDFAARPWVPNTGWRIAYEALQPFVDRAAEVLMDHPGARIGRFTPSSMAPIIKQFGFYAMRNGGRTDMFMHGLALTSSIQKQGRAVEFGHLLYDGASA
jgi:choline dehydrogenase-like flavoprotein